VPSRQRTRRQHWREILEYFEPAVQFGMTATPLRDDNRDTYEYFGNPIYTYSLKQGIEDGFLAPYRVHRVVTTVGCGRLAPDQRTSSIKYGREIPDDEYQTKDFERSSPSETHRRHRRTHHRVPEETDRFAKTIVFCVDQEHADEMRKALNN
jgi:type I restriction enzyme R subunit